MNGRRSWIGFVALRWFRARRSGGGFATTLLAAAGIATGCAALVVVLSVMNGFQLGFIEAILELDSHHVRLELETDDLESATEVAGLLRERASLVSALPFSEREAVALGPGSRSYPLRVKVLPSDAAALDPAFDKSLEMLAGLPPGSPGLAVGAELARLLGVWVGDSIELLVVDADVEEGVSARTVQAEVSAVFRSGYYEFDAGLAFCDEILGNSLGAGKALVGVKLADRFDAPGAAERLASLAGLEREAAVDWSVYNRSFFGALRLEKSVMMLLVGLIFLVVGVSIFHAMRRAVFERMEDIAVLKALGGDSGDLRTVFTLEGLGTGLAGAIAGAALGLAIAANINEALGIVESAVQLVRAIPVAVERLLGMVPPSGDTSFKVFSPTSFYLIDVPSRPLLPETLFVAAMGASSAAAAAWLAAARVPRFKPSEVLRDE
ncbi:MAG: ABC transporter permease [Spirochaetales bacterium]|nr:ABC transporter permease [Spirochaetales bacterium]